MALDASYSDPLPFTKHDWESGLTGRGVGFLPLYAYDARSGVAEYHNPSESAGAVTGGGAFVLRARLARYFY